MADAAGAAAVVYIGLGANLNNPARQVEHAIGELAALPQSRLGAVSRLYRTAPLGPQDQPHFVNAAVRLDSALTPPALLEALQGIERAHGRVRDGRRWGPRTLDLDLLLHGDLNSRQPGLTLPHPEIHRRAFVLVPLLDIAPPTLLVPGQGVLAELLERCGDDGIEPLVADTYGSGVPPRAALS
jgi:2-amino-4-hydroxy-6-hydroxymethyldihydropteridine diphosphokinase